MQKGLKETADEYNPEILANLIFNVEIRSIVFFYAGRIFEISLKIKGIPVL